MAEKKRRRPPSTTSRKRKQSNLLDQLRKKFQTSDFKPDAKTATWIKTIRLTRLQRLRLTKWTLYILTIMLCLVAQDVIMSRLRFFGSTTNLAVCAILLITIIEGTEVGSLFVLIASVLYSFTGTAPGAYCIALMTFLGIAAVLLRQLYWHRSKGSIVLCAAVAVMCYEMGLFVVGLTTGLTLWSRIGTFALNGLFSAAAMVPLYPLIYKIGLIGGNTWKE